MYQRENLPNTRFCHNFMTHIAGLASFPFSYFSHRYNVWRSCRRTCLARTRRIILTIKPPFIKPFSSYLHRLLCEKSFFRSQREMAFFPNKVLITTTNSLLLLWARKFFGVFFLFVFFFLFLPWALWPKFLLDELS